MIRFWGFFEQNCLFLSFYALCSSLMCTYALRLHLNEDEFFPLQKYNHSTEVAIPSPRV